MNSYPDNKDYIPLVNAMNKEINTWRNYFLEYQFLHAFKDIPEVYKNRIRSYFLSIPSDSFTEPLIEFHNCISAVLQNIEERK